MRISDWSSDVCSSDLRTRPAGWSGLASTWHPPSRRSFSRVHQDKSGVKHCWHSASLPCAGYGARSACPETKPVRPKRKILRSEEHTSELQSLMRISYAVFCLKTKKTPTDIHQIHKNKTR